MTGIRRVLLLLVLASATLRAEDTATGQGGTGLAPTPPPTTSSTTQSFMDLRTDNLNASRNLYSNEGLPGLDRVTYSTVDPINPNLVLEGLNKAIYDMPKLDFARAAELAKEARENPEQVFASQKNTADQTGAAARHPIEVLGGIAINWMGSFFFIVGLCCGMIGILRFMHTSDYGAFVRQGVHWLLLAGLSCIVGFLVW